jgi:hypothetical protein
MEWNSFAIRRALNVHEEQAMAGQDHIIDETNITRSVVQNGVVIIEAFDSPSIRREKNMRRKAERLRAAQSMYTYTPSMSSPVAGPSHLPATTGDVVDSDLSSLMVKMFAMARGPCNQSCQELGLMPGR